VRSEAPVSPDEIVFRPILARTGDVKNTPRAHLLCSLPVKVYPGHVKGHYEPKEDAPARPGHLQTIATEPEQ